MTTMASIPSPEPGPAPDPPPPDPRRHDLDALRAFAMLLGIALHAALTFAPIPWIAMNKETSPAMGAFVEVVHGFRLPLFFLMSGYFSAMLLRRRGIGGFLSHRWKRIGLPLLLGMFTVIPAMWGVIIGGNILKAIVPAPERDWGAGESDDSNIWKAAATGDLITVELLVQSGVPVDEPDPRLFTLPLAWAATGDHAEVVAFLLEAGADPSQRMGDDNIPLHTACFYGASESAALMLEAGADLTARNRQGETPVDSMKHGQGAVTWVSDLLGIEADFEQVQTGRRAIRALIEERTGGEGATAEERATPIRDVLAGILGGELFMHLWFLWHLCWFACGLALITAMLRLLPRYGAPSVLVATPLCLVGLIPLTALTQSWQANFGPDTSAGLIPDPHVLAHYAVFFGFGALMHGVPGAADRLGRAWWIHLPIAAVTCAVALRLTHDPLALADRGLDSRAGASLNAVLQSVFVWTASFGLMGLARLLLSRPSKRVRYVSDSSYWLYVAHLPVIVAGQFALAYVPLPPLVEFALLTAATTVLLLLTYQWLVRYTWVGRLLNGPRARPGGEPRPRQRALTDAPAHAAGGGAGLPAPELGTGRYTP
jgi:surface polysaccharide O-acyltransferase-like enzyme